LLQRKSDMTNVIGNFHMIVKNQYKADIIQWMLDEEREFNSKRLDTFIKKKEIIVHRSAPYTSQ